MPDASILGFVLTCILVELTPGPNMTYLALLAMQRGRRTGFAAVAGVALGLGAVGVATALGLSEVIAGSPRLAEGLRWAGAAYFAYLAWEAWHEEVGKATLGEGRRFFLRGLGTNLINPKAFVFFVTVLPAFMPGPDAGRGLLLSGIYVGVATAIHIAIVSLAGFAQPLLANERAMRLAGRVFAVALLGVGVWVALG